MLAKIRNSALGLLTRREHSKFELQQKLTAKGFVVDDITQVIDELAKQGLQSDARFTESYVNMRRGRGFGPVRIEMELHSRGIDQELSRSFCDKRDPIWLELAETVRCKKFGNKIPGDWQEQVRQIKYLHYKGFTADHIKIKKTYENTDNF